MDLGYPAWVANFALKPMDSVEIVGTPVAEKEASDGTVMIWQVSNKNER